MNEKRDTTYNMQEKASIADRLPELDEDERKWSEASRQKSWAFKNMSLGIGHVWHMDDNGLIMQVASEDTMRLLTVVEHEYCFKMVSYIKATLDCLGLNLDTNQAVIRPYTGGSDEAVSDAQTVDCDVTAVEVA